MVYVNPAAAAGAALLSVKLQKPASTGWFVPVGGICTYLGM